MRKIAFLDACVFYPISVRDLLLQLAVDGFYQAKWSPKVEHEFTASIERDKPLLKGKLSNLLNNMRKAIPDYSATETKATIELVKKSKTDSKDVNILAATIDASCNYLVTFNIKDFDSSFANKYGLKIIHPDAFISDIIDQDFERAQASLDKILARLKNPPKTKTEFCKALTANKLIQTAQKLS